MTDETTARDRAIEIVNETIGFDRSKVEADMLASEIVAGLLARPEVLCALAASPTADVAELSHLPVAHSGCPATAGGRCIVPGEHPDHGPAAAPERDAARAEVERLRRDVVQHEATIRYLVAERDELRARDEAAKAVVRWWQANRHREAAVEHAARVRLDALARAHEAGGQDR